MRSLQAMLAAHPLREKPYNAIRFTRCDGNGTPLYIVGKDKKELGAGAALKLAFESWGGHCFHCKRWMRPQPLAHQCTRDHLRARRDGGRDYLHNLVLACGECNRSKGGAHLVDYRAAAGAEYLNALDVHLSKCLARMAQPGR